MAGMLAVRRVAAVGLQSVNGYGRGRVLITRRSFSPMAWYNAQLEKSPVITKSITSGGGSTLHIKLLCICRYGYEIIIIIIWY